MNERRARSRDGAVIALVVTALTTGLIVASALSPPRLVLGIVTPTAVRPPASPVQTAANTAPDPGPLESLFPEPPARGGSGWLTTVLIIIGILVTIVLVVALVRALATHTRAVRAAPIDSVIDAPVLAGQDVADVLRRAHEQVGVDDDAGRAIVRCWEALEALGADAGIPRDDTQTAEEYVVTLLAALDVPAPAVRELSRLYARALFGNARLSEQDRHRAIDALRVLESAVGASRAEGAR